MSDITTKKWERVGGRIYVFARTAAEDRLVAEVYAPSRKLSGDAVKELERVGDLIAAAPDLCDALERMVRAYEQIPMSIVADGAALRKARAALLSARGEE